MPRPHNRQRIILQHRKMRKEDAPPVPDYWRPKTYGDCMGLPRPCPYVGCRYHLMSEARANGSLQLVTDDVTKMAQTCALDVATQAGPQRAEDVAEWLGLCKSMVQQVEFAAIQKLRARAESEDAAC